MSTDSLLRAAEEAIMPAPGQGGAVQPITAEPTFTGFDKIWAEQGSGELKADATVGAGVVRGRTLMEADLDSPAFLARVLRSGLASGKGDAETKYPDRAFTPWKEYAVELESGTYESSPGVTTPLAELVHQLLNGHHLTEVRGAVAGKSVADLREWLLNGSMGGVSKILEVTLYLLVAQQLQAKMDPARTLRGVPPETQDGAKLGVSAVMLRQMGQRRGDRVLRPHASLTQQHSAAPQESDDAFQARIREKMGPGDGDNGTLLQPSLLGQVRAERLGQALEELVKLLRADPQAGGNPVLSHLGTARKAASAAGFLTQIVAATPPQRETMKRAAFIMNIALGKDGLRSRKNAVGEELCTLIGRLSQGQLDGITNTVYDFADTYGVVVENPIDSGAMVLHVARAILREIADVQSVGEFSAAMMAAAPRPAEDDLSFMTVAKAPSVSSPAASSGPPLPPGPPPREPPVSTPALGERPGGELRQIYLNCSRDCQEQEIRPMVQRLLGLTPLRGLRRSVGVDKVWVVDVDVNAHIDVPVQAVHLGGDLSVSVGLGRIGGPQRKRRRIEPQLPRQ
eukprot:TRINITY_DN1090_c0_g1_i5.p1 TRINITY_DN1090_c0_g1~~TRINITY_DN1090_c0_g1_i5.p1  ORF type:complete len:569 (-),score=67.36 TRINITY_DN1090_c0_g1_i5:1713-3419(-)